MIQANELRIGNYISDIWSPNGFFKVTQLKKFSAVYGKDFTALYDNLNPIPLTEEILLKAGFEKCRKGCSLNVGGESFDYYIKDKFVIWDHKHRGYSLESIRSQGFILYNFLHQLQNLFFALTGEEIKIDVE